MRPLLSLVGRDPFAVISFTVVGIYAWHTLSWDLAGPASSLPPETVAWPAKSLSTHAPTTSSCPRSLAHAHCKSTVYALYRCLLIPLLNVRHTITSVGSTEGVAPEVAGTFSAGGFSNIFPQPDYQSAAAQAYLTALNISSDNPLSGRFNTSGRGFPDISTTGRDIAIIVNGTAQPVLGTSASTPILASMVALVNEQLLNAGQTPLGFLNPLLYSTSTAAVFNDIVVGNNPGCGTPGFPALPGWDPVCLASFCMVE